MRRLCVLLCLLIAGTAAAHDSWLARDAGGRWQIVTGSRYPVADAGVSPAKPVCRSQGGISNCWTELAEHTIELEPRLVEVYLREIRPPQEQLAAWAAMKVDGLPWRESYRKFARVETGSSSDPAALRAVRQPAGLPLEIVVDGDAPLRPGLPSSFRVFANGRPVAGFAVELVSERSGFGVWQRSDAEGRIRHAIPFAGEWVLRGTLLEREGEMWRSRFVTLVFVAS